MNRTYNLVSSVKGGCGKTTFSVWLTYYLSSMHIGGEKSDSKKMKNEKADGKEKENQKKEDRKTGLTLLVDMDLLGTSMQYLLMGAEKVSDCLNDIFKASRDKNRKLVKKVTLSDGMIMNVIFSSMDSTERNKFKLSTNAGHSPIIKQSVFRKEFSEILKKNNTIEGKEVEHFVFDMPPNSDGFSDAAMECVFGKNDSIVKKNDRANLFIMIGSDMGQTMATIEELRDIFCGKKEKIADRIFIVFNSNTKGKMVDTHYESRKQSIEESLRTMGLTEKEKDSIYFLVMHDSEAYAQEIGIAGGGMNSSKIDITKILPQLPIKEIAQMEETSFRHINEGEEKELLLKLIWGE